MDPNKRYLIEGHSCGADNKTKREELLAIAEKRAEMIKILLIQSGFPADNLETVAYNHGSECKVTVVQIK